MDNGACSYRRFLDGDEKAFDEILIEYQQGLTFFINTFLHDLSASEDIAIDTFMVLLVHKHRYNFKTPLKAYLYMVGRCKAIDYLRHKNKLKIVEISEAENEMADYISLEENIIADERKRIINSALKNLPQDMRVAVHLVYFENLSYAEAAKVMKKNAKQVDNLLFRAKEKLRNAMGKDGELLI